MKAFKRSLVALAVAAALLAAGAAQAQVSDNVDQDRRAVRHVEPLHRPGRRRLGRSRRAWRSRTPASRSAASRSRSSPPTTRTSRTSARRSRGSGTTSTRSTSSSTRRTRASRSPSTRSRKDKGKAFLVSGAASSDLTGKACSPNTIHWTYDTWMLANGTGSAIVKTGGDSWFFLTADYAFGHALERDTEAVVLKNGGKVLGKVRASAQHAGLQLVPAAGAGVEGEDHRPRERRRRHDELDQAGGRVRHRQGRPEPRRACWCSSPTSIRSACRRRRA